MLFCPTFLLEFIFVFWPVQSQSFLQSCGATQWKLSAFLVYYSGPTQPLALEVGLYLLGHLVKITEPLCPGRSQASSCQCQSYNVQFLGITAFTEMSILLLRLEIFYLLSHLDYIYYYHIYIPESMPKHKFIVPYLRNISC